MTRMLDGRPVSAHVAIWPSHMWLGGAIAGATALLAAIGALT